jgi:hypothetical protein
LVKTRSGAARLIEAGKVRINGTRALTKPPGQGGRRADGYVLGKLTVVRVLVSGRRGRRGLRALHQDLTPAPVPRRSTARRQSGPRQPTGSPPPRRAAQFRFLIADFCVRAHAADEARPAQGIRSGLDPPRAQQFRGFEHRTGRR